MNALTIFQFEDRDQIRVVQGPDGEPWFVAVDICKALGYLNTAQTVDKYVDPDDRGYVALDGVNIPTISATYTPGSLLALNESGLYALILGSQKPEARRFKRYVTSEVLPSIRKTGAYELKEMSPAELLVAQAQALLDHERHLAQLDKRVELIEDTYKADQGQPPMMTVAAYATFRELRLSTTELASAGKRAKHFSDMHGYPVEVIAHKVYGKVNAYHIDVLREVFKQRGFFEGRPQ